MNAPDPNAFSLDINDPEDAELIEYFLSELPAKIDAIQSAVSTENVEQLCRLAHQLKGAAPGFGFPAIGGAAADLDDRLRGAGNPQASLEQARSQVESLVALCKSYIQPPSK